MAAAIDPEVGSGHVTEGLGLRRFLVTGAPWAWVVNEGSVDLFVQEIRDGELAGPRRHLTRVPEGESIFGMAGREESDFAIVASPSSGSRITRMSRGELEQRLRECPSDREVTHWIEAWVLRLAMAASTTSTPKKFVPLQAEQNLDMGDSPQVVAPTEGVLWVKHLRGTCLFLAKADLPTSDEFYFPVCKYGWLETTGGSSLHVIETQRLGSVDPGLEGLHGFHRFVLARLAANQAAEDQQERSRLAAGLDSAQAAVRRALSKFTSAVDGTPPSAVDLGGDTSPAVMACRAVGRTIGVKIVDVPDVWDKSRYKDAIMAIAKASSVRARRVILRHRWWKGDSGPLVGFRLSDDRPLALLPVSHGTYEVYDPVEGTRVRINAAVSRTLSGIAYSIYRPFPEKPVRLKDLLAFGISGCRRDLVAILVLGFLDGLLSLVAPITMGILFDSAIPGAQRDQVLALAVFLLMSAFCSSLFSLARGFAVLRLQGKLDAALQAAAWDRLLRLPPTFFRQYSSGDLANRSMAFKEIGQVLSGPALSLVLSQMFSMLSYGLLFVYSLRLALIGSALICIAVVVSAACLHVYLRFSREVMALRGRISGIVMELVSGVPKFRVSGTEDRAFAAWADVAADRRYATVRARRSVRVLFAFNMSWPVFSAAVIFMVFSSVSSAASDSLTTGSFLAFLTVFNQVMTAALWFAASLQPVMNIVPLYERAKPILESTPEVDTAKTPPGTLTGTIDVNHLTFRYNADGPTILRDLSFSVGAGEMVAIVGSSGCGKSTLFRILLGFERAASGAVYYDGQDLAGLDVQAVREQIGVVLQNSKPSSGTILNLIVGSSPLTIEEAWEAARMTGLDRDIAAMPMGMHTPISEGGGTLSGGQRQRLMIAAALVNRPRILLFDEATSALDNETQAIVTRSLESLRATRVVIAHRLSTIINADRVLVLDNGAIAQSGTYHELISQSGPFRELAKRQIA